MGEAEFFLSVKKTRYVLYNQFFFSLSHTPRSAKEVNANKGGLGHDLYGFFYTYFAQSFLLQLIKMKKLNWVNQDTK